MPASTEFTATAYLDPSGGQKVNLKALEHKFRALANDQAVSDQVNKALDQALSGAGLTHDDVLPWLGSEIAVAADFDLTGGSPTVIVLIKTTDEAATQAALSKIAPDPGSTWTTIIVSER